MEDDELTRAHRALRGVDPELDLTRVYAESRTRAHGAAAYGAAAYGTAAYEDRTPDDGVEILLSGTGPQVRRLRTVARPRQLLAWGAAAAAATALAVTMLNLPVPGAIPGGMPGTSAPAATAPTGEPLPSPTTALSASDVVARAAQAVAGKGCTVKARTTLGEQSATRVGAVGTTDTGATGTETSVPAPLGKRPLDVLGAAAVDTALGLAGLGGRDHVVHEDLRLETEDGVTRVRVRITPSDGLVQGGDVAHIDLLVDTTTWLPQAEELWAESDDGREFRATSQLSWLPCGEPSPGATDDSLSR